MFMLLQVFKEMIRLFFLQSKYADKLALNDTKVINHYR